MQTHKKSINKRPQVRSLKIQPKIRINVLNDTISPEIKLCGNWLAELGFHYGKRVMVTMMNELLIIRLEPEKSENLSMD